MPQERQQPLQPSEVYETLKTKITTLEFKPGTRLVEDTLSTSMAVGRTPVREALLRLQGEGLVDRANGWSVAEVPLENIPAMFECRAAIEGYATRLSALRRTEADVEALRDLVNAMDAFETISRARLNELNRMFHERIVQIGGNPMFIDMHKRTQLHYWNLRFPVFFSREQTFASNEQHKTILDAISRRDADAAEAAARTHIAATLAIVCEVADLDNYADGPSIGAAV